MTRALGGGIGRREFLGLAGGTLALGALGVPLPRAVAQAPPACYPGGPFDPDAWMAARGQGDLKTLTPQANRPLRGIKATTLAQWKPERTAYLNAWREIIGPWPARPALAARVIEVHEDEAYTRMKVGYASLSGDPAVSEIRAWLMLPRDAPPGRRPAIVCLHQTIPQGKDEPAGLDASLPWYAFADYYARRGYVTLAPDAVGYGERTLGCYAETGYELGDAWPILQSRAQMTLLGLMLFDVTRAVDYLQSRVEVDPARIGVIGHSLGGILVNGALPLEPRLKVGVASCGYGIFRSDGYYDRWASATSAYLPRLYRYRVNRNALPVDWLQLLATAAPAAHLVQTALGDTIWTPPAVAPDPYVAREMRRVHGFYGRPQDYVAINPGGAEAGYKDHGFYPETQVAADELFARVLRP